MLLKPMTDPGGLPKNDYTVIWSPQAGPQTALLACPVFEVFYGGARGGGKTESSLGDWMQHANLYGEAAVGVFFRRKFKQLSEVIARSKQLFKKLGATYNETKSEWVMPGGARLLFRYLERDSDAEEYQGHNYTRIYIEELTNFPSADPVNLLRACLRSATGVPTGMRLTGNPGGPGHKWVKARYIDPAPGGYKILKETMEMMVDGQRREISIERVFIPSKLTDNRLLFENDPTYVLRLSQAGSKELVKAWLEGNWDIVDGAFFDNFSERNILQADIWYDRIPRSALHFRSFDWGSAKPFSCGWWAVSDGTWGLPAGALVRYAEWYGASAPNKGLKMTAENVARGILAMEKTRPFFIRYGAADPSVFVQNGGPSIAEKMASCGISWNRADNKRIAGAEEVRSRIQGTTIITTDGYTTNEPMLYILDTCEDSIEQLQTIQHADKDPEDVDTEAEDHAYDDVRYGCMSRPWVKTGSQLSVPGGTTFQDMMASVLKSKKHSSLFL